MEETDEKQRPWSLPGVRMLEARNRFGAAVTTMPRPVERFQTTFNYKCRNCLAINGSFNLASLWNQELVLVCFSWQTELLRSWQYQSGWREERMTGTNRLLHPSSRIWPQRWSLPGLLPHNTSLLPWSHGFPPPLSCKRPKYTYGVLTSCFPDSRHQKACLWEASCSF